jgi:hypothetical protein
LATHVAERTEKRPYGRFFGLSWHGLGATCEGGKSRLARLLIFEPTRKTGRNTIKEKQQNIARDVVYMFI